MGDGAPCGRDGVGDDKRRPYGGNSALKKTLFNCRDWSCSRTLGRQGGADASGFGSQRVIAGVRADAREVHIL